MWGLSSDLLGIKYHYFVHDLGGFLNVFEEKSKRKKSDSKSERTMLNAYVLFLECFLEVIHI